MPDGLTLPDTHILVVTHKPYWMPEETLYLPLQVGFGPDIGFTRDNTGENIAEKNASYCEMTGLYWAWKNLQADFLGLAHYRRYFAEPWKRGDKKARILTGKTLAVLLAKHDILLPTRRRYYIETNWSQYAHAHHEKDLLLLRQVIAERAPAYLDSFDRVMKRTWGHRFNMFVMKRPVLDRYCAWLFDLLFAVEERLDTAGYSDYDKRVFGFLAERLLDVWLCEQKLAYREVPCLYMEDIHWPKKAWRFLERKFTHRQGPAANPPPRHPKQGREVGA